MADGALTFGCTNKNCASRVSTDPDITNVLDVTGSHTHDDPCNSGAPINKRKSTEQLTHIPSKTVVKESDTLENTSMVLVNNVGADAGDGDIDSVVISDNDDIEPIAVYSNKQKLFREKSNSLEGARKEAKMQVSIKILTVPTYTLVPK